ncbi:MAG: sirohydrochlorin chelatase [Cyanobacteria bacterium P01_F01_bin.150]
MNFSSSFSANLSSSGLFDGVSPTAYLLVIHGSRDPRPARSATSVAQQVQNVLAKKSLVGVASLECASSPLHQQIMEFSDRAIVHGCQALAIVPLFLLPGVHVRDDIPEEVELARKAMGERLPIRCLPYLGSNPNMGAMVARQVEREISQRDWNANGTDSSPHVILMAHGSRRTGGNHNIEAIAAQRGIVPAYWSVSPKLSEQIDKITVRDQRPVMVVPYFLFAGGITDAIARTIEKMNHGQYLNPIVWGEPLDSNPEIVTLIVQQLTQEFFMESEQEIGQNRQNLLLSNTLKY